MPQRLLGAVSDRLRRWAVVPPDFGKLNNDSDDIRSSLPGLSEVFRLYTAGDELLAHQAELLVDANRDAVQCVRRWDVSSRVGGDRCKASVADSVNAV